MEKEVVEKLIKNKETISVMESCTGGYFSSTITNISGSSEIFNFGVVTYSNDYKIKFGVNKDTIDKYSVYSNEVSREMSLSINKYTNSTYSIGITGQIGRIDPNNPYGKINEVFASIYNSKTDKYTDLKINFNENNRLECKKIIVQKVLTKLNEIL